jgi:hypothetical protein
MKSITFDVIKFKKKDGSYLLLSKDNLTDFKKEEINLKENNALIDNGQLNYIGELIRKIFTRNELHGKTLKEVLDIYEERIEKEGIEEVLGCKNGSLVFARKYEVAAVINRFKKNLYV